ncbi:hypothetical protein LEMLEM_LOCUS19337 [Lemmus lemmus]
MTRGKGLVLVSRWYLRERRRGCPSWRAWASAWARLWVKGCPRRHWPLERSWMPSSSYAKICGQPCSKSTWMDSEPTTSSWPSPAASCAAPSIHWASRA